MHELHHAQPVYRGTHTVAVTIKNRYGKVLCTVELVVPRACVPG